MTTGKRYYVRELVRKIVGKRPERRGEGQNGKRAASRCVPIQAEVGLRSGD